MSGYARNAMIKEGKFVEIQYTKLTRQYLNHSDDLPHAVLDRVAQHRLRSAARGFVNNRRKLATRRGGVRVDKI